jgi:HD superfamily phosphohydrolase YqeK
MMPAAAIAHDIGRVSDKRLFLQKCQQEYSNPQASFSPF